MSVSMCFGLQLVLVQVRYNTALPFGGEITMRFLHMSRDVAHFGTSLAHGSFQQLMRSFNKYGFITEITKGNLTIDAESHLPRNAIFLTVSGQS